MTVETKIRKQGNSFITTVPMTFVNIFDIETGSKIEWEYDTKNDEIVSLRISKKKV